MSDLPESLSTQLWARRMEYRRHHRAKWDQQPAKGQFMMEVHRVYVRYLVAK